MVDVKGAHGRTPLHVSVMEGQRDLAVLLIKNGASISIKDDNGATPFQLTRDTVLLSAMRSASLLLEL